MKIWLSFALVFIVLGALLFTVVMSVYDWDFKKLNTSEFIEYSCDIYGGFDNIVIDETTADIELVRSKGGKCKIECFDNKKVKHTAVVENDTLKINYEDSRKWYDFVGISFYMPKIILHLPEDEYVNISIKIDTGDVVIPKDFVFDGVDIEGSTGDIKLYGSVLNNVNVKLSTGDVAIEAVNGEQIKVSTDTGEISLVALNTKNSVKIDVNTGEVYMSRVNCGELNVDSSTGNIKLVNVIASAEMELKSSTGDVIFEKSDAYQITVESSTGSVKGSLKSAKIFIVETSTGKINVPESRGKYKCYIKTSTGDVDISI